MIKRLFPTEEGIRRIIMDAVRGNAAQWTSVEEGLPSGSEKKRWLVEFENIESMSYDSYTGDEMAELITTWKQTAPDIKVIRWMEIPA